MELSVTSNPPLGFITTLEGPKVCTSQYLGTLPDIYTAIKLIGQGDFRYWYWP